MAEPRDNSDIPISCLWDYREYRDVFGLKWSYKTSIAERVFDSLVPVPGTNCMVSTYRPNNDGYIQIRLGGEDSPNHRFVLIHRLMWALTYNEWPPVDRVVKHGCDTRDCCAPGCLTLGTQLENMEEMVQRGRARTAPRFSDALVAEVRRLRATGLAHHVIARQLGVGRNAVRNYAP